MSSVCSRHADVASSFVCPRCGTFSCVDCERRAYVNDPPVCPGCWARRPATALPVSGGGALQTAGLVLGVLSIFPCCPVSIVSLAINIFAIVQAKEPPARDVRWRAILGLVLTLVFGVLQGLFLVFYQVFQHSTR